jgi:hypothetical protein
MKFILKLIVTSIFVSSISYIIVVLHSWHKVEFKTENITVFKSILKDSDKLGVIHFLTPACGCSSEVLDHLLKRNPLDIKTINEVVVLLDDYSSYYSTRLRRAGYSVFNFDSKLGDDKENNKFVEAIKGVPLLIVFDQEKNSKYVGGYTDNIISPMTTINIEPIITKIQKGNTVRARPVKGCAISEEYKKILDPLGIKYANN